MNDEEAANHARKLTESAMSLTDKLLDDLNGRSGFSLDADARDILRTDWIVLTATHLVDNHSFREQASDERFPRPVVCAWCGNRHRSIVPPNVNKRATQGDACATSVFQVTEQVLARVKDPVVTPHGQPSITLGEWLMQGHYGSSDYDCALLRFVQNPPTAAADPICDNCVGERITAGDLERTEGQFPW